MRDFWLRSGYRLLKRNADGRLAVTDDFLRAYFSRPEIKPIETSCQAERTLHADLMAKPRLSVPDDRIAAIADTDTQENYRVFLEFRERLLRHSTLESFYLDVIRNPQNTILPLFVDQVVQAILRGILRDCGDPFRLRAAELFFRIQTVTVEGDSILMADEETVEMRSARGETGAGDALVTAAPAPAQVELDVLNPDNADPHRRRKSNGRPRSEW